MKLLEQLSTNYSKLKNKTTDLIEDCSYNCRSIFDWCKYRTIHKYHIIDTKLEPGYHDSDTLLMHAMFSILVDFVEIEKAWMYLICHTDRKKTLSWFDRKFREFRSPQDGLAYLNWEITDTDDYQSISAQEILDLYIWWTVTRPQRIDAYVLAGYDDTFNMSDLFTNGVLSPTYTERTRKLKPVFKKVRKIEEQYEKEDEKMLCRLVKIRRGLWT